MNVVEFFAEPAWQRVGMTLVHFLWQGLVAAVLAGLMVRLLSVRRGNGRYGIYLAAFAVMAACPVVTFFVVEGGADVVAAPIVAEAEAVEAISFEPGPIADVGAREVVHRPEVEVETAERVNSVSLRERIAAWYEMCRPWMLLCWAIGVVLLSARLLLGMVGLRRWRRYVEPLEEGLRERVLRISGRLWMEDFAGVFISARAVQAMAVGCLRPMVLLPAAMVTRMDVEMLEAVIAHELAHIRRLDLWVNLGQRVVETFLFYHPAVWWLSNRLRDEREYCCDELAVAATGERLKYAATLENASRGVFSAREAQLAAGFGREEKPILARVRHILGVAPSETKPSFWIAFTLCVVMAGAIAVTTLPILASEAKHEGEVKSAEGEVGGYRVVAAEETSQEGKSVVRGYVYDADGEGIENVMVQIREERKPGQSGTGSTVVTDANGYYEYDQIEGRYHVGVVWYEDLPDGSGRRHQSKQMNEVLEKDQTIDFHFGEFPRGNSNIAGQVRDQNGDAVKDFTVDLQLKVDYEDSSGEYLHQFGFRKDFSYDDGGFAFLNLPEGTYTVRVMPAEKACTDSKPQEIELGEETSTIVDVQVRKDKAFYGRLLFEDGSPAKFGPGSKAFASAIPPGGPGTSFRREEVDDEGYFTVYLGEALAVMARSGYMKLRIEILLPNRGVHLNAGEFPAELLASERVNAGVFKIKRPPMGHGRQAEGKIVFDEDIPVTLSIGSPDNPVLVRAKTIRFETADKGIRSTLTTEEYLDPIFQWYMKIEVLDGEGNLLDDGESYVTNRGERERGGAWVQRAFGRSYSRVDPRRAKKFRVTLEYAGERQTDTKSDKDKPAEAEVRGYSWDGGGIVPIGPLQIGEAFNYEIRFAAEATDRDSAVEHYRRALAFRPNDPENIMIEYKMAVMLSQYQDPKNPQPLHPEEALAIFERIVNSYDHERYYSKEPKNSIEEPEIMVPRAAVHAAGLTNDASKARQYSVKAMQCLQKTYERRRADWLKEPAPRDPGDGPFGGSLEASKFESRKKFWEKRQAAAKEGDVFGPFEMQIAEAAVRAYGYSFGEKQDFEQMSAVMNSVIEDYPGTPMAKIAARFIERGEKGAGVPESELPEASTIH